jgi:putative protein-disulfide isomerase
MVRKTYNCTEDGFCVIDSASKTPKIKKLKSKKKQGKIIYFGDPMCSWCWGISDNIEKIKNKYNKTFGFEMVMGGLRSGGDEIWSDELKDFLKHHWKQVNSISGQPFDYGFFSRNTFDYNTEPACRAVRIIRDMAPELEFDFYKEIQYKFYAENEDPKTSDFYRSICAGLKIPFKAFRPLFLSSVYCDLVEVDFKKARDYGVRGFPTVMIETNDQQIVICNGFSTFEEMDNRIQETISKKAKKAKNGINILRLFNF